MRLRHWLALLALVLTGLLIACGDDDDDRSVPASANDGAAFAGESGSGASDDRGGPSAPSTPADTGAGGEEPAGANTDALSLQIQSATRQIIYTSTMVVVVDDVLLATRQAQAEIAAIGGLVFGQDTRIDPRPRTVLTFKVRPADFDEALTRLAGLGELEAQQTSADDVTDRVVDLESQIITAEASVERLRGFLENATDLETVASLERELLARETSLELLRGQLRTIQDQVALATIFLTLTEPEPPTPEARVELAETAYLGVDEGSRCPGDDELTIDEDEAMTICVVVVNVGTLTLTEIEVRDVRLDLDEDDFTVLEGSLERLEPDARLIGYWDTSAESGRSAIPTFSAVPIDEDGEPVRITVQVDAEAVELTVIEDTSIPGFSEGFARSWDALITLGRVAILASGVLLPFIWLPLLVLGAALYGPRVFRRTGRSASASEIAPINEPRESATSEE